jgi:hypothetical protein
LRQDTSPCPATVPWARQRARGLNSVFLYAAGTHAEAAAGALTQIWLWPKEGNTVEERQASHPPAMPATARQQDEVSSSGIASSEAEAETRSTEKEVQPEGELVAAEDAQREPLDTLPGQDIQGVEQALQRAVFDPAPTIQLEAFVFLAEQGPRRAVACLTGASPSFEKVSPTKTRRSAPSPQPGRRLPFLKGGERYA